MGDKRQEIANELILIISGKKQKVKGNWTNVRKTQTKSKTLPCLFKAVS